MTKILVIGAGGVGSVAVHKMAMLPEVFSDITLASRREFKCTDIAASVKDRLNTDIKTAELDADDTDATARLIEATGARAGGQSCAALSGSDHHGCLPEGGGPLSGYGQL